MRHQSQRKSGHHQATANARRKKTTDRKQRNPLSGENTPIPPSSREEKLPSVNLLEDSSEGDDEDKPTDYELLLSTFKPLAKKPRLMADEREKMKDATIGNISGGGGRDFHASVQEGEEGEGGGAMEEREGEGGSPADEDSCSDGGETAGDDDAAGKGYYAAMKISNLAI